jgi:hypothetical protein
MPPSGRMGNGSTRASLELMADLRALINAGLVEPSLDGGTIRYAAVDVNNEAPCDNVDDREPQNSNRDERVRASVLTWPSASSGLV